MLNPPDHVSLQFDSLNLTQIINKPTRYDNKCLDNVSRFMGSRSHPRSVVCVCVCRCLCMGVSD